MLSIHINTTFIIFYDKAIKTFKSTGHLMAAAEAAAVVPEKEPTPTA